MEKANEKQKEFERLLKAYVKSGEVPGDIDVDKIICELWHREDQRVLQSMSRIAEETHNYLAFLFDLEGAFNREDFGTLWESIEERDRDENRCKVMLYALDELFRKLEHLDEKLHFREIRK